MRRTKIVCTMGPNTDKKKRNACTRKKMEWMWQDLTFRMVTMRNRKIV